MTFVNSWLWIFLPLAAIPIILHLLTLLRLKTVELSTFRFLFDSYVQQRRRMQFLEALLAALRTLFVLALVVLVMKPLVKHWNDLFHTGGGGGREVILLVDCSASMNAQTAGESSFGRAKSAIRAVVKNLKPEDRVTLVRVGAQSKEVFRDFTPDATRIDNEIDALATSPARANFLTAFNQVFGPEAPRRTNPVVYVFTDCQSSGWREVKNQRMDRLLPSDLPVLVVNVGSNEPLPNVAVIGDPPPGGLARRRAIVGLPVHLTARLANYSPSTVRVTLETVVNGKTLLDTRGSAQPRLTIKPGETVVHKIVYTPTEPGEQRGAFKITGNRSDRFADDDSYLFALSVLPRLKVLLVNGNPANTNPLDSETRYLWALADDTPGPKPSGPLGGVHDLARSIDFHEVPESAVNPDALKDTSVVVLANCGGLNGQQFIWLRDFVSQGGGLLVFPGDKVNPDVYNKQFFPIPNVPGEYLTPVQLGPAQGEPEKRETYDVLASLDYTNPALAVFDDPQRSVPYFKNVQFFRRFPLTIPDKQAKAAPLVEFARGGLALVENRYNDGLVVVAGFPANRKWSNLPTDNGKEFVPLLLRLISRAQHRPEVEAPSAVLPGGLTEFSVTGAWAPAELVIHDDENGEWTVPLERSGSRLIGAFDQAGKRGYYTLKVKGDRAERHPGSSLVFAVNLAPEESDFHLLDQNGLQELLPTADVTFIDASAEAQQALLQAGDEVPVWHWLIYLVFLIIGVEFLLATLGGKRSDTEEKQTVAERVRRFNPGAWIGRMTGAGK
jgi:hypothetical protein